MVTRTRDHDRFVAQWAHAENVLERVGVHPQSGLEIHEVHCARESESGAGIAERVEVLVIIENTFGVKTLEINRWRDR